jgi:hypothetical protein
VERLDFLGASLGDAPGAAFQNTLRLAGACVAESLIFRSSPTPYFSQSMSFKPITVPMRRNTMTGRVCASVVPCTSWYASRNPAA